MALSPVLAQVEAHAEGPTASSTDVEWGLLGDMAGHDFEGKGQPVIVRWIVPGVHLRVTIWAGGSLGSTDYTQDYVRDPGSGVVAYYPVHSDLAKPSKWFAAIDADGSVREGKGSWSDVAINRGADGFIRYHDMRLEPLEPGGKVANFLASLISKGRAASSGLKAESGQSAGLALAATSGSTRPPSTASAAVIPVSVSGSGATGTASPPTEARKEKWGALAQIAGKSWYCVGGNPAQWFARKRIESGYGFSYNRSPPVIRLTTGEWIDPYSSLKVTTALGDGRGWVDTITLQPDGSFLMSSEGVQAFAKVRGYSDGWTVTFPLGKYGTYQNKLTFGGYQSMPIYELASGGFGDDARCLMEIVDSPDSAARFQQEYLQAQRDFSQKSSEIPSIQADMANDRALGAQMRGNMQAGLLGAIASGGGSGAVAYFPDTAAVSGATGSSFYEQLTAMADHVHREAEQSKRQLDRTLASAAAQNASASVPQSSAPAQGQAGVNASVIASNPSAAVFYSCIGSTKKRMANGGDGIDTMFYGVIASSRDDIDGATSLFRQHTGSGSAAGSADGSGNCFPHQSRAEAEASRSRKLQRDSGGSFNKVTVDLSM